MLRKLAIVLVAFVALFVALPGRGPSLGPSAAEAYPGADNFQVVGQECLNANNVRLQMAWTSYNLGAQWFDVSLQNNGWIWGTVAAGQVREPDVLVYHAHLLRRWARPRRPQDRSEVRRYLLVCR